MEASKVSQLLAQQLSHYANRSKVIASNIANIDTPGYKTKDIVSFDDVVKSTSSTQNRLQMTQTNSAHMHGNISNSNNSKTFKQIEVENLREDRTGNNVDIDKQMAENAKNTIAFNATKAALKKNNQLMKSVIESSVKMN
jgi:flagellar basal-body rod protein FlgB